MTNTMQQPTNIIYLASNSPRRRELLKQIDVQHDLLLLRVLPPRLDIDESPRPDETPHAYVERVVRLKADMAVKVMHERKLQPRPILTADTTVSFEGDILGKPVDRDDAVSMLKRLAGETHQVLTAVILTTAEETYKCLNTSFVTFSTLSEDEPMDKAGAYAVQGRAAKFIVKLSGSYSGVVGLPLFETAALLRQAGIQI
jgi:septum formation protein